MFLISVFLKYLKSAVNEKNKQNVNRKMAINSKQNGDNGIINLYYSFNMNKILTCYSDTQKDKSFCFSIVAISLQKEFAKDDIFS